MSGAPPDTALDQWLDRATRGVSPRWAASIRAELTAHFEDTTADLLRQGVPSGVARQQALAALGDPQAVARGFKDVHHDRRHYLMAALACVLLLVENFDLPQQFLMPDWADGSAPSRIFYAVDHALAQLLALYVIIVAGRLAAWRLNCDVTTPMKIVLGGLGIGLTGILILDLGLAPSASALTLLDAPGLVEGVGFLLRDAGMLLSGGGLVLLGAWVLLTPSSLAAKSIAAAAALEGIVPIWYVVVLYLSARHPLELYALLVLNTLFLLSALGLAFIRAWDPYRRHHLPAPTT
jgi:hypothetical protein